MIIAGAQIISKLLIFTHLKNIPTGKIQNKKTPDYIMKNLIVSTGVGVLALVIGCSNPTTEDQISDDATMENAAQVDQTFSEDGMQIEGSPADVTFDQSPSSSPAVGSAFKAGVKLNPPHGEPGHRCEINVGDPLPDDGGSPGVTVVSPPPPDMQIQSSGQPQIITSSPSPTPPVTTTPAPTSIMNSPAPSAPAPSGPTQAGMNPPHGEPGHDCAVPVGSPLPK